LKLKQAATYVLELEGVPSKDVPVTRDGLLTELFTNSKEAICPISFSIVINALNDDKNALSKDEKAMIYTKDGKLTLSQEEYKGGPQTFYLEATTESADQKPLYYAIKIT